MIGKKELLNFLKSYKTDFPNEKNDVAKFIDLINAHPDIFFRKCEVAHITGSALVINLTTRRILLHKHKKLNRWLQFGGHADGELDIKKVALKEATEESGLSDLNFLFADPIDLDLQLIPARNEEPEHYHLDFRYLMETSATSVPKIEANESQELNFFSIDDHSLENIKIDPSLHRLISKTQKLINNIN
ncbi:MAG TPA: NUDIX hydrolase [Candidatus Woesebacteria bacterium]|mgnify:CR=1 FL=1|jgi:ADP-ribose pyrophosphatase YjhB (NUDIX family)|nr:NUDIX hydrolase [Candidatus Woesebacteria bacterium]